jgi:hypothetical protein
MTTFSHTPILEQSIMQGEDLSNKQKAELLFDKVRGLPCWLTDSVMSDVMIIIIMVRKSPYIIYLVFWQIIRCCLLILHLLSIGRIRTLHRIEPVIYANEISREDNHQRGIGLISMIGSMNELEAYKKKHGHLNVRKNEDESQQLYKSKTRQMICEVNMFDCDLTFIIPQQYVFTNNQLSLTLRGMNLNAFKMLLSCGPLCQKLAEHF